MGTFTKPTNEQLTKEATEQMLQQSSWLPSKRYSILLYGSAKVGKTWAYCSIIEDAFNKGKKVFVINTDGGLATTFKQYFKDKYEEVAKNITYMFCASTADGIKATEQVLKEAKKEDWVIVDLMSDFWEMAQDEFLKSTRMSPDEYIQLASKDPKKFGMFDSGKWNYIKYLDNAISNVLSKRGQYNILAVCNAKDIEPEKKIGGIISHEFDNIGFKPGGQKTLSHSFETITFLGGTDKKFFKIAGNRGAHINSKPIYFGENFWEKFKEMVK